jgi:hypothetical protein
MKLHVTTYAGYKADERPVEFTLGPTTRRVREIVDRWYGEDHAYFKVIADDGNLYLIRHDLVAGEWELTLTETLPKS